MKNTSLCYIEKDESVLLLHKNVKKDINLNKWVGVGGKFSEDESPFDCVKRECLEETGLTLVNPKYRGIVTFVCDGCESEQMHLFTASEFTGSLTPCSEGDLKFVKKSEILSYPHWEGDGIFLKLIFENAPFFSLKLVYEGERLVCHTLIFI